MLPRPLIKKIIAETHLPALSPSGLIVIVTLFCHLYHTSSFNALVPDHGGGKVDRLNLSLGTFHKIPPLLNDMILRKVFRLFHSSSNIIQIDAFLARGEGIIVQGSSRP